MKLVEQSDSEKETNDSRNTFYQNAIHYKEGENAFIKKFVFVIKQEDVSLGSFQRTMR